MRFKIAIDKLRCIVIRRHAETLGGTAQGVKQAVGFEGGGEGPIKLQETARPGRAGSPPPAAECQQSLTGHMKQPKHGKAAFRPSGVSLAYITRPGGGWRRSQEYTAK